MLIGTNGIVVNELGQVLLIRRNDTRTMAPPGGSLESGELPTDSLAREVREETGLIVMPVRLVGLYFVPLNPTGNLAFVFRCIQRGGQLGPTEEAPMVAFYPSRRLPAPMISFHRQRLEHAIHHRGGPPIWLDQPLPWRLRAAKFLLDNLVYRYLDLRRAWRKQPPHQPPTSWKCSAYMVACNSKGQLLWQRQAGSQWALPGDECRMMESPWQAVARAAAEIQLQVKLTDLRGVYVETDTDHLHFVFSAEVLSSQQTSETHAYFDLDHVPKNSNLRQLRWAVDSLGPAEETIFHRADVDTDQGDKVH